MATVETESSNILATANSSLGTSITESLSFGNDVDYYSNTVGTLGVLDISPDEPAGNSQSYTTTAHYSPETVLDTWSAQNSAGYQVNVGGQGDYYIPATGASNTNPASLTAGFATAADYAMADTVAAAGGIPTTTTTLTIGSSTTASIDFSGDRDYIMVNLVAGTAYKFDLKGVDSGAGTLSNPYLTLHNPSGTAIRVDDNGAMGYTTASHDSQIVFIAQETGTYYLDVSGVSGATGTCQLSSTTLASDYYLQPVLDQPNISWHCGTSLGSPITVTYSFPTSIPLGYTSATMPSYTALSTAQQADTRAALQYISTLTHITFTEVADQTGEIRFGTSYQSGSAGVTRYSYSDGSLIQADIELANNLSYISNLAAGTRGGETLVHEIMHSLGLKHPGNYNATGGGTLGPYLPTSQDTDRFTIESYNFESIPDRTPAMFDIAALQYLYGADQGTATGNNTYLPSTTSFSTIWDAGGIDTLDGSLYSTSLSLDLSPGTVSYSGLLGVSTYFTPCIGIAFNCWVENATGGSGNDQLLGNTLDNVLTGGRGNDILDGGAGADTAVYSGLRSAYTITRSGAGYTISGGTDGTDTLVNVELLKFSDATLRLNSSVRDDFNGDGKDDVLWRNASTGEVSLWQMNGSTQQAVSTVASAVPLGWAIQGTGDFNGDGKDDILWRNTATGEVAIWQMNGSTQLSTSTVASAAPLDWAVQGIGDFNGDGKKDILWRNTGTGDVAIWQMNGSTQQAASMVASAVPLGWAIQGTGDFNGDGKDDILWRNTATGDVAIWQMNGSTQLATSTVASAAPLDWAIQGTGDFNGDGKSDILWRNTSTGAVAIWQMNGASQQAAGIVSSAAPLNWVVQNVGDFNGDGKSDILWRNISTGDIAVWQMNGLSMLSADTVLTGVSSNWSVQPSSPASPLLSPHELAAHDFNGDGKSDVLWRHASTGEISIWQMNGSTKLATSIVAGSAPLEWAVQGSGDFNGDGKSDILWRNTSTGDVAIWQMNGSIQQATSTVASAVPLGWAIQGTADFNGDGRSDILWRDTTTGNVAIWQMNGPIQQATSIVASASTLGWAIQGTGDFNGDGKSDILWRNTSTGDVAIWQMNGATQQTAATVASKAPLDWAIQGTGDFNGDGKSDILWRNTSTGAVAIWQMNGATQQASGIVASGAPLNWVVQSIGDFNGDHKSDILWRNTSTGDVALWQMDGMTQQSASIVATGTPLEWHIA